MRIITQQANPENPKIRKIGVQAIAATLALAAILTLSCSSDDGDSGGDGSDKGNNIANYKTVKIGEQTWIAENLNYAVEDSKCYGEGGQVLVGFDENDEQLYSTLSVSEIQSNCSKYGRLYTWEQAKSACPSGWHLPSNEEWTILTDYAGDREIAGKKLKATSGWSNGGNGTDEFGFSALPGGYGDPDGYFGFAGSFSGWWSATESSSNFAYSRLMNYGSDYVGIDGDYKGVYYSVRCVKD